MEENEQKFDGLHLTDYGALVNDKTGEIVGNGNLLNGGITIDSSQADVKSLEDMGYSPLTETEEEYKEAMRRKGVPVMKSTWEIMYEHEHPGNDAIDDFLEKKNNGAIEGEKNHVVTFRKSKYEVRPDTSFLIRFGIVERSDGDGFYTIRASDVADNPDAEGHWVKFRMWTYDEKLKWKEECREFNSSTKAIVMNVDMLNERKIRNLILDWSFAKYGEKMRLLHCDGKLSEESYSMFLGLYPPIANAIVDLMNSVLESRQI